ncbi:IucA/IucC family siderophore biosynthesis protein [Desmonostoc muscorum LEGE 12446]|uniref:IucA/IucC family protein n=1 Tax=Desmonostoc muscorum TaxID=1179 RepID=UPI001F3AD96B|nr:IucA/IucC family siderophore biosynthesis protein [Desmonostoc muscorum]MCF2151183.1 IucA/IucC family siderophore biosynthesis protein [Desmonostoc muscorum LEGE 12446]
MIEQTIITAAMPQLIINRTDKEIAEQATIQSFFNCYLRETGTGKSIKANSEVIDDAINEVFTRTKAQVLIRCYLEHKNIQILAGLRYYSLTGRHLFYLPIYYQPADKTGVLEVDYVTLVSLLTKELALADGSNGHQDELLRRVVESCCNIEQFVRQRRQDTDILYAFKSNFIETEQALIFGHPLHPTPKSRQGFAENELAIYSPELKGSFPLYYFRAHQSIVESGSALPQTAIELIKAELLTDGEVDENFKMNYCRADEYALLPVHPWQANFLRCQPGVQQLFNQGLLEDLGLQGRAFMPTSSIRTVYHSDATFMVKLSLNVKITNSMRAISYKELKRAVELYQLLNTGVGNQLCDRFPQFNIIREPAYITLKIDGEPSAGFASLLRENVFPANPAPDVTCLISLCQDAMFNDGSRLTNIINLLAKREQRTTNEVSRDWFRRYLTISLEPILWLYFTYGIGLEAHQQNSVLQLQDGYPYRFFFRDNQDYYCHPDFREHLDSILPGFSNRSYTVCKNAVAADERLGYYFFNNHLLGLINAFGVGGLVDERVLLAELRTALDKYAHIEQDRSKLLHQLRQSQWRCKANLISRFHDIDEMHSSLATHSIYATIDNPLVL